MQGVLTLRAELHLDSAKKLGSGTNNPLPDTGRRVSHVSVCMLPLCFAFFISRFEESNFFLLIRKQGSSTRKRDGTKKFIE